MILIPIQPFGNLALDHVGSSTIFERNYLSRMLRYSTQDAFWNRDSDAQAAKSASRIGRLRDPNRPRKLTEKQSRQEFGELRMAVGEPIHDEYQELGRMLNSTVRAEERALLKRILQEYDDTASVEAIQRQIKGILGETEHTRF
ncbi:hypothetical protein LTR93_011345 [Exophiala xenobiotica]|nr:hypothetical protein LTR93_011345 [Exophiala xenobiotica]